MRQPVISDPIDKGMNPNFFDRDSLFVINSETLLNEILQILRDGFTERDVVFVDLLNEFLLIRAGPRNLSMQNLINDHSDRPNIIFSSVDVGL